MSDLYDLFGFGEIAALLGAALFGLSNIIYRSQRTKIDATTINTFKTWGAAIFFFGVVLLLGLVNDILSIPLPTLMLLCLSIIIGAGIGDLIYLKGQEMAGVSRAFPVVMSFPLMTYIIEVLFLRVPFQLNKGLGIVIIVLGVILIGRSSLNEESSDEEILNEPTFPGKGQKFSTKQFKRNIGLSLAIFAAILWSIAALVLEYAVEASDPISATFVRALCASIFLIPLFLYNYHKGGYKLPSLRTSVIVLIAGFFGMTLGAFLYVVSIKDVGASTFAALSATSPLFTLPLAVMFLKERITPIVIVGTILTVLGVLVLVL